MVGKIEVELLVHFFRQRRLEELLHWLKAVQQARHFGGEVTAPTKLLVRSSLSRQEGGRTFLVGRKSVLKLSNIKSRQCAVLEEEYLKDLPSFKAFAVSAFLSWKQSAKKSACRKARINGRDGVNMGQVEISRQLNVDQSTISRVLKEAQRIGLIFRQVVLSEHRIPKKERETFVKTFPEHNGKLVWDGVGYRLRLKDDLFPFVSLSLRGHR